MFGNVAIYFWTMDNPRNIAFLTPIIITCEYTAKIVTTTLTYDTKMSAKLETLYKWYPMKPKCHKIKFSLHN